MILLWILIGILITFFINIYMTNKGIQKSPFISERIFLILIWPILLILVISSVIKGYVKYNQINENNDERNQ
jgi:hypothetical protein